MISIKVLDELQFKNYYGFISTHPQGHILQTIEWGEVKRSMGWEPLPVGLFEDEEMKGAMLILKRRLPVPGINKSIFYAPRGPVIDIHDHALLDHLFKGLRTVAKSHGAIFLKIDPDIEDSDERFKQYLTSRGFKKTITAEGFEGVQPTYVFRLDISPDEEELLTQMASKTRYNIRLAKRRGVTVRESADKKDLESFYQILLETAERDKFLIRGYRYFEEIWEQLVQHNLGRLFMAEYQGRDIAGTLAFILGNKVWYIYGASSNEFRNVMPNYLLQWTMIKWGRDRGCSLYDFRGVSGDLSEDNPLYGLYRFKKGFAGTFTEFIGEWDLVYSHLYYWLWVRALPMYYKTVRWIIRWRENRNNE